MPWGAKIHGVENLAPEMLGALREGEREGLEALGVKGAEMVVENIRTPYDGLPPAVAFGNLAGSITSEFRELPDVLKEIIGVSPSLQADRYAPAVETGTRAHIPPVSALLPWVEKKFSPDDEKHALSIAWAIARKIAKKGTRGHEMFSRALTGLEPLSVTTMEKYIAVAFARHGFVGASA